MNTKAKIATVALPFVALLGIGTLVGCSNAQLAAFSAWGTPAVVENFSGGKLVYAGISTGKIQNEAQSDGYYFQDACKNNALTEISGTVVITRPNPMPSCADVLSKVQAPTF